MIAALIRAAVANRVFVLLAALALAAAGVFSLMRTPLDALPDLSDTQVIIRTGWAGQSPQVVEDQVTYPLATTMLSVPGARTVRAYSFFGDSYVYVLFDDSTDLYWARSRVLEYLSQVRDQLPAGVNPSLGPDATGLGWVYEYALVDRSGRHDLGELRALQDWFLRYQLKTVPDVAEVASLGGMERAWQIVPDPSALAARGITVAQLVDAVLAANGAGGGSVIEQGEAELMVRSEGYLRSREDFERVPVGTNAAGVPVLLGEVATVRRGPSFRRGIAELDGQGEVAGGVVVLRSGKNAKAAIVAVKARARRARAQPAGRRRDRADLRPSAADRRGGEQPVGQVVRRISGGRAGVCAVPRPSALGAGGGGQSAAGRARRVHRAAPAGRDGEPDVARRHRHRDRRDGRCGGGDDRERAQASGALARRA